MMSTIMGVMAITTPTHINADLSICAKWEKIEVLLGVPAKLAIKFNDLGGGRAFVENI